LDIFTQGKSQRNGFIHQNSSFHFAGAHLHVKQNPIVNVKRVLSLRLVFGGVFPMPIEVAGVANEGDQKMLSQVTGVERILLLAAARGSGENFIAIRNNNPLLSVEAEPAV